MNLAGLIASFRFDVDDQAEGVFSEDEDLTRLFNEAEDEACVRKQLIFESRSSICTIQLSAGVQSYKLNPLWIFIEKASVVDTAGAVTDLAIMTRQQLDRIRPNWRTDPCEPRTLIQYDSRIEIAEPVTAAATLRLEGYRKPLVPMAKEDDTPEINSVHHIHLVEWVKHRAYSRPDSEVRAPGLAQQALEKFEEYFGKRPDADQRKDMVADEVHHTVAYF